MELLDFENHVKLIIAVFVVMWLFECGNLTIQHIFKNCYFFEDLGENIFRTCCHVSGLVQSSTGSCREGDQSEACPCACMYMKEGA